MAQGKDTARMEAPLLVPTLEALKVAIQGALRGQFAEVEAEVTRCPDLRKYGIAAAGLGAPGRGVIADVGGVIYMNDPDYHAKGFNFGDVRDACGFDERMPVLLTGAAGCNRSDCTVSGCNVNGEMVANAVVPGKRTTSQGSNQSWWSGLDPEDHTKITVGRHQLPARETMTGPLANLFLSDGSVDHVVHVKVKQRRGEQGDVFHTIRQALVGLEEVGGEVQVGVVAIGIIHRGKVDIHVMRDFYDEEMVHGTEECNSFCKHFEKDAGATTLTAVSTIVTGDPKGAAMTLRLLHTHLFGKAPGDSRIPSEDASEDICGHYHYDTTPEDIEYELFLLPAGRLVRIESAFDVVAAEKSRAHVTRLVGEDVWASK